jgi:mRNA interferase MazF
VARILRGDVWWADLDPTRGHEQAGVRPVLVISREPLHETSGTVIALAITSRVPRVGFPLTREMTSVKLPKPSWVKINQVRTISTERLGKRIGRVAPDELAEILEGLFEIVG